MPREAPVIRAVPFEDELFLLFGFAGKSFMFFSFGAQPITSVASLRQI
jgi:hypothetical protein